jgi:Tat protein translocase TatB subunit
MFGTLGGQEILFILVIALIVFGPRKLPDIGKNIGRMMAEFRKASNDFKRTLEDEVEADKARVAEPAPSPYVEPPPAEPVTAAPVEPYSETTPGTASPAAEAEPTGVQSPEEPTVSRPEPAGVGRPDGRPDEPH